MAEPLKPCPFCGGTSFVGSLNGGLCMDHEDDGAPLGIVAEMYCERCGCRLQYKVLPEDAHEVDADEMLEAKWNHRAERTCHMVADHLTDTVYCNSCGERFDSVAQYMAMVPNGLSVTEYEPEHRDAKYCPRCGAKVV